jgi:ferredoxin|eukprot:845424_1
MTSIRSIAACLIALLAVSNAFSVMPSSQNNRLASPSLSTSSTSSTQLHFFGDALKGAFSNDDDLGKVQNAGLKNGPKENDKVSINGKKVKAIVGQKVSIVAAQSRVKISYNCKAGDCGTCNVKMNGRTVKACQMIIPAGKCDLRTM